MRSAPPALVRTLGGLLALALVLAVAISYLQNQPTGSGQTAATVGRFVFPGTKPSPAQPPAYAVLASRDESLGARTRTSVEILVNGSTTPDQVDDALAKAAEAVRRQDRGVGAVAVSAFMVDPRSEAGRRQVGRLVWSPDGRGWDGTARGDFGRHITREAE